MLPLPDPSIYRIGTQSVNSHLGLRTQRYSISVKPYKSTFESASTETSARDILQLLLYFLPLSNDFFV